MKTGFQVEKSNLCHFRFLCHQLALAGIKVFLAHKYTHTHRHNMTNCLTMLFLRASAQSRYAVRLFMCKFMGIYLFIVCACALSTCVCLCVCEVCNFTKCNVDNLKTIQYNQVNVLIIYIYFFNLLSARISQRVCVLCCYTFLRQFSPCAMRWWSIWLHAAILIAIIRSNQCKQFFQSELQRGSKVWFNLPVLQIVIRMNHILANMSIMESTLNFV